MDFLCTEASWGFTLFFNATISSRFKEFNFKVIKVVVDFKE